MLLKGEMKEEEEEMSLGLPSVSCAVQMSLAHSLKYIPIPPRHIDTLFGHQFYLLLKGGVKEQKEISL